MTKIKRLAMLDVSIFTLRKNSNICLWQSISIFVLADKIIYIKNGYNINTNWLLLIMVYIYILQLQGGKYYVGKTKNPQIRLESHFNLNGSKWTQLYKPLKVLEIIPNCDDYDEDKYTQIYMDKFGINNVRGGSFTTPKLDRATFEMLKKKSNSTNDRCFVCGKSGHFAKDCDENYTTESEYEIWICHRCDKEFDDETKYTNHTIICVDKTKQIKPPAWFQPTIPYDSVPISSNIIATNTFENKKIAVPSKIVCFRCGRDGHFKDDCFANRHIKGYILKY